MASGKPFTNGMREQWIKNLYEHIQGLKNNGISSVLAYSDLRRAHRQRFIEIGINTLLIHLEGPKEIFLERMQSRAGHFVP